MTDQQEKSTGQAADAKTADVSKPDNEVADEASSNPLKKRKVALFMSYVGHGYQGMQRNPGAKTIEDDLFKALVAAGGISEANSDENGPSKIHFMRAARTDKGVSAVGQVCSLMLICHPSDIVDRINEKLPPPIRVYGFSRVTKGFDSRKQCDKRRYEYIMPTWMFDPKMRGIAADKANILEISAVNAAAEGVGGSGANMGDDAVCDAAAELAAEEADEAAQPHVSEAVAAAAAAQDAPRYGSDSNFQFDQSCVDRFNEILSQYEGTHNFHNYTIRVQVNDPSAKRYILSFKCEGVFQIDGKPWVKMVVIGQSFMLHQIRKMVGMALAEFRGEAPAGCLQYALGTMQRVVTPMAPDLGLFLDECYYDAYNDKWGTLHGPIGLNNWSEEVAKFKAERLYPALARRDHAEQCNAIWLTSLRDSQYQFSDWLKRPDASTALARAKLVAKKKAEGGYKERYKRRQEERRNESGAERNGEGVKVEKEAKKQKQEVAKVEEKKEEEVAAPPAAGEKKEAEVPPTAEKQAQQDNMPSKVRASLQAEYSE